ncbi:MAG: FmdB family zinc ribbon protein [Actinomycetota bacterium]
MPTYEYACKQCGHRFEVVQSMKDDSLATCPDCGGELRRVLHAAGLVFKGSGFYVTDNRAKPKSDTAADENNSSKDKDTKDKKDTKKEQTTSSGSGSNETTGSSSSSSPDKAKSSGSTTKKENGS